MTEPQCDSQLLNTAIEQALAIADAQGNHLVAALLAEALDAAGSGDNV